MGKKIVVVVNKIDILGSDEEVDEVVAFVADRARALLGFSPDVFPVSSRLAQRAKGGEPAALAPSRFPRWSATCPPPSTRTNACA